MATQQDGVYADHPFPILNTPVSQLEDESKATMFHHIATEMVQIHNVIFRGLNSIYLQAEQVSAADGKAFCNYMAQWSRVLHLHHEGEELIFFPAVERLTGDKSLMEVNLEQHAAFHDGVERFDEYVNACLAGRETFSGKRVVELIDGFGPVLATHLTDEIGTLLALEKYNEKLKELPPIVEEQAKHGMSQAGFFTGFPFLCVNLDRHFENDRWMTVFPPGPGQTVLSVVRNTTYWVHRDWWKYGACDRFGKLQPLFAGTKK